MFLKNNKQEYNTCEGGKGMIFGTVLGNKHNPFIQLFKYRTCP